MEMQICTHQMLLRSAGRLLVHNGVLSWSNNDSSWTVEMNPLLLYKTVTIRTSKLRFVHVFADSSLVSWRTIVVLGFKGLIIILH